MESLKRLLGIENTASRIYNFQEAAVTWEDFTLAAAQVSILFSPFGLVNSLGPTWNMLQDPRFARLEEMFVRRRPSMFGGNADQGVKIQLDDGTFLGSESLEQMSEIIGEGRFLWRVLQNMAVYEAMTSLSPMAMFKLTVGETPSLDMVGPYSERTISLLTARVQEDGITLPESDLPFLEKLEIAAPHLFSELGVPTPSQKAAYLELSKTYPRYFASSLKDWPDEDIHTLFRDYYPNCFFRNGEMNGKLVTLKKLIREDLVGLVADYAELPNIDDIILLDGTDTLFDPAIHKPDTERVHIEIENADRALSHRAEVRVMAARVIHQLGLSDLAAGLELTDMERDHLARLMFVKPEPDGKYIARQWPGDKPAISSDVMGFLFSIKAKEDFATRNSQMLAELMADARAHIAKLKSGEIQPISRQTEPVVENEESLEEKIFNTNILSDHVQDLLRREEALVNEAMQLRLDFLGDKEPSHERIMALDNALSASKPDPATLDLPYSPEEIEILSQLNRYAKAIALFSPLLDLTHPALVTVEQADEVLQQVDKMIPPKAKEVPVYEGVYPCNS